MGPVLLFTLLLLLYFTLLLVLEVILLPLPREEYGGQGLRRYRDAEEKVEDVRKLREELERITN